jgi:hypothetical protein
VPELRRIFFHPFIDFFEPRHPAKKKSAGAANKMIFLFAKNEIMVFEIKLIAFINVSCFWFQGKDGYNI